MRATIVAALAALALTLAATAPAAHRAGHASAACPKAWSHGWVALAKRVGAPVYCPTWLPDPLKGQIGGRWNNVDSVSKDGSYLESFVWQDTDGPNTSGELHVNLRGYPGRTRIPTCHDVLFGGGKPKNITVPCFADPHGTRTINGIRFTEYTVNQDADQWHLLYAWHHRGGLYTVSEHVAPPLTFDKVRQYLDRITRSLVLVQPAG